MLEYKFSFRFIIWGGPILFLRHEWNSSGKEINNIAYGIY
jgi:hypothetical protein